MRSDFVRTLVAASENNRSTFLVVGDLGYGVIEPFRDRFPDRFLNAGVAEQNMIGLSAGLASQGMTVFVYSIANFPTFRALEQIRNDVSYHGFPVIVVAVGAGLGYGTLGYTHHAVEDLAVMRAIPNMDVYCPADDLEVENVVREAIVRKRPAYIRLGKGGEKRLIDKAQGFSMAGNRLSLCKGGVMLLSIGSIGTEAMTARRRLAAEDGVNFAHYSCPSLYDLDLATLGIENRTHLITVEEHSIRGGFGSFVLEELSRLGINIPTKTIGIQDTQMKILGSGEYLKAQHGLDAESIRLQIREFLNIS